MILRFRFAIFYRILGYDYIEDNIAVTALDTQAVLLLVLDGENIHQRLGGIDRYSPERCRRERHTETVGIIRSGRLVHDGFECLGHLQFYGHRLHLEPFRGEQRLDMRQPKKCFVEVFGEDTVKNPYASANYLMNKPHVLAHIKALLSSERFEMETMAVKLQVAETLKAVMDETATSDYTDRFGVPLSPAPLRAVSVNAAKALMDIFPIRHKEENRLRIEGSDGNVIFNVIVPQNPMTDGEKET